MNGRLAATLSMLVCVVSCVRTVQRPQTGLHSYGVNETMARQVRNATNAGDGDYHIRMLRQRVMANPQDLKARLELADSYRESGFPDVAVEHYRVAASQQPDSAQVVILMAKALRSMDMDAEARATLERFNAQHPKASAEALSWLGILDDDLRQHERAEANHRSAVDLAPGNDVFHNNLGYNLLLQKRNGEAIAEFRKALELNPKSKIARNNLGLAAPGEALKTWSSEMDAATAHSNMAAVFIEQGEYQAARRELDSALGYKKDHSAALRNLQLLSELDGGGAKLPDGRKQSETRWEKFAHTMKVVMIGTGQTQSGQTKNE